MQHISMLLIILILIGSFFVQVYLAWKFLRQKNSFYLKHNPSNTVKQIINNSFSV